MEGSIISIARAEIRTTPKDYVDNLLRLVITFYIPESFRKPHKGKKIITRSFS